uniref:HTH cro/C1-type domain-containing protein n=1 Tax=viral metagenome TaxID=1070528 RepID=A0A6C0KDP6_9ZZZZ
MLAHQDWKPQVVHKRPDRPPASAARPRGPSKQQRNLLSDEPQRRPPPPPPVDARALLRARQANGMTQKQLAQRLNVSAAAVQQWESGRAQPRGAQLAAVRKALKL